jgi:hypothetical protein
MIVVAMLAADVVAVWHFRMTAAPAEQLAKADRISLAVIRVHFDIDTFKDNLAALASTRVPVQREIERVRSPLVSIPPLRSGDFQGIRVYRSDVFLRRARKTNFRAQQHRFDEPTRLSLGVVASLQSPLPFYLAMSF